VYTNPIPGDLFEIATRALEGEEFGNKVQYGQAALREQVFPHYKVTNFLSYRCHSTFVLTFVSQLGLCANYPTDYRCSGFLAIFRSLWWS
jgi:hypothetical protein